MEQIIFSGDRYQMNWLRPDFPYGEVSCPKALSSRVESRREGDLITTEVQLTNRGAKPFFTTADSISISFPLEDRYDSSAVCMTRRCHSHIFCGEEVSYIMALRMGGEAPHLGMVLTQGSLSRYSVRRDLSQRSNDRGCFYLHPSPMEFLPGETKTIRWVIFPHRGRADFKEQLKKYSRYIDVQSERYVLFLGEKTRIAIRPAFGASRVTVNGKPAQKEGEVFYTDFMAERTGDQVFHIEADGVRTWCRLYVHEAFPNLIKNRCRFIAEKQQYRGAVKALEGAYLLYDNEEGHTVYQPENDYNGGRERVGMGMLIARYLRQGGEDAGHLLADSLERYTAYVLRELVDPETGTVCNDIGRDDSYKRLYNLPWFVAFFLELYHLHGKKEYLVYAYRILRSFYAKGGAGFYPIFLPILAASQAPEQAGMAAEKEELTECFIQHADTLAETGLNYPASEVNYEQSIVAPAADVLLQVYLLTGEKKYLEAGRRQVEVLELFNGIQPDYHLYETAIRHWDGYWFGKYRLYGDTFPHYWSALTGNVFALYARITGDQDYARRAEDSRRGVLPMVFPDGSASCAYLYPRSVNGTRGEFYDPYANDQDWGLYFYAAR